MNTLSACVNTIDRSSHLCLLRVSVFSDFLELLLVESPALNNGDTVTLVFKETEVIIQKSSHNVCSANTQKAIIESIDSGLVLTSVTLTYHDTTIVSLITTSAYKRLELTIGDEIIWMLQPSEISLLRDHDGV